MTEGQPLAGRKIRVVAPARWVTPEVTSAFAARAQAQGATVEIDPQCFARDGQLAGDDATREAALWAALSDPTVDVVWAARGGYGALRLLDRLAKRPAPKARAFVGYSDMTAIHQHLYGSPTTPIHAAMPFDLEKPEKAHNLDSAFDAVGLMLGSGTSNLIVDGFGVVRMGEVTAPLVAANLSVLTALLGTPHEPKWESAILCLEDVDEYLYALDRMVWRLAASALRPRIKAIVIGEFAGTLDNQIPWGQSIEAIIAHHFPVIPIVSGPMFGHGEMNLPMVLGAQARLSGGALTAPPGSS